VTKVGSWTEFQTRIVVVVCYSRAVFSAEKVAAACTMASTSPFQHSGPFLDLLPYPYDDVSQSQESEVLDSESQISSSPEDTATKKQQDAPQDQHSHQSNSSTIFSSSPATRTLNTLSQAVDLVYGMSQLEMDVVAMLAHAAVQKEAGRVAAAAAALLADDHNDDPTTVSPASAAAFSKGEAPKKKATSKKRKKSPKRGGFKKGSSKRRAGVPGGGRKGIAMEQVCMRTGSVFASFTSIRKAAEAAGISRESIRKVVHAEEGGCSSAHGWCWRRVGEGRRGDDPSSEQDTASEATTSGVKESERH
jgi:hypothetical protein